MTEKTDVIWEWLINHEEPGKVVYIFCGETVGKGDEGFNNVLKCLWNLPLNQQVIIRYPLFLSSVSGSFEESFPFYKRMNELEQVIFAKNLSIIYELAR